MTAVRPAVLLVVGVMLGAQARAQTGADAARRALIDEAAAASRAGDHPRALELASRALALHATPSLRYFLAREHLTLGHAVEALALATECAARARGDATVTQRDALLQRCESIAREAEGRVARLTVRVPSPAPAGLRVTVRGEVLDAALYDVAVPMAPGEAAVRATAEGREGFVRDVALAAGARETVSVELAEPPPPPPPPPVVATPVPVPPPPVAVQPLAPLRPPPPPAAPVGPWVLGGIGVAGLVAGGVLGGLSLAARGDRDAACPSPNDCDRAAAAASDGRYRDLALGANVALAAGGALLAGGLVWWAAARWGRRSRAMVAPTAAGLVVRW